MTQGNDPKNDIMKIILIFNVDLPNAGNTFYRPSFHSHFQG